MGLPLPLSTPGSETCVQVLIELGGSLESRRSSRSHSHLCPYAQDACHTPIPSGGNQEYL